MKKCLAVILSFVLLGVGAMAASAQSLENISVEGGYVLGSGTTGNLDGPGDLDSKASGFVGSASADVFGPLGVQIDFLQLTDKEFSYEGIDLPDGFLDSDTSRIDLLASYTVLDDMVKVKALGGYSFGTWNFAINPEEAYETSFESKFNNFVVGGLVEASPLEKLNVKGQVLVGLGCKAKVKVTDEGYESSASDEEEFDASSLSYKVSASYLVTENIGLEAGYLGNTYKFTPGSVDIESAHSGLFVGVRASF